MKKDVVAGLGEIGSSIMKLFSKASLIEGYDLNPKLMGMQRKKLSELNTRFLHVCIPFTKNFEKSVIELVKRFSPQGVVIHSTISPRTTKKLQTQLSIPVIYSATRGIHKRMIHDLKRYTKFYTIEENAPQKKWAILEYKKFMKKCGIKTKQMSSPLTLELAKIIVDTSYYGWLINYAQLSNMIAIKHGVDYDEMWTFADEIHKFLGNRPKMYPGFIGGHCVIENLSLVDEESFWQIDKINNIYASKVKNVKSIAKRYNKK